MHARQETITGTFTQVLSVLQELKDGNSSTRERQISTNNTQSERSTYLPSDTNRSTGRHYMSPKMMLAQHTYRCVQIAV